jgi:two-component system, LuxR family, response regulator FixJ
VSSQQDVVSARPVVVIVDDDPAIRNSLAFSLRTEGITVLAYASGAELLQEVPVVDSCCLVIDYKLPGMNGLDLLAELRRRQVTAPAILITTHPSAAVRERAAASGTALIEKPLLGDALFAEIRAALAA